MRSISSFSRLLPGAACASLLSSVAVAQPTLGLQPSLYAGLDYQHSTIVWEDFHLPTTPPTTINGSELFADSFSGAHVHVGGRFGANFGVELGYMWLPKVEKNIGGGNMSSLKVQGVTLDAMGYLPIDGMGRFEVIGLVGGAWLEGTAKLNGPSFGTNTDVDPDWNWRAGGGAQYRLSENINLRGLVTYEAARFDGEVDHALNVNVGLNFLFD